MPSPQPDDSASGAWRTWRRAVSAAERRRWRRPSAWRTAALLAGTWAPIVLAAGAAVYVDSLLAYAIAAAWIGVRQIGVFNVMHEAVHQTLAPDRRWNDRLGDWFGAWPLGTTTEAYRKSHLAHHRHVGRRGDPDLETIYRRQRAGRLWPRHRRDAWLQLAVDASGVTFWRNLLGREQRSDFVLAVPSSAPLRRGAAILVLLVGAVGLQAVGLLLPLIVLWVVPLMTSFQVVMRLHQWGDHLGLDPRRGALATRHVEVSWLGRVLHAPTYSNHHLAHHLFPEIPCYRLPLVQARLDAIEARALPRAHGYLWGERAVLAQVAGATESVHGLTLAALEE